MNEWREADTTLHVEEDKLDHVQVGSEPKTGQMVLVVIKNRTKKEEQKVSFFQTKAGIIPR